MSVAVSKNCAGVGVLHPSTAAKVAKLCDMVRDRDDLPVLITSTLRTAEEQDSLWSIGRNGKVGKPVTNCRYPDSAHNWGIALDFCKNSTKDAFTDETFFKIIGELAESCGMEWGGRWKMRDLAHLQDTDFSVADLKKRYGTLEEFLKTWNKG